MTRILRLFLLFAALLGTSVCSMAQSGTLRAVQSQTWYGDNLGTHADDVATKTTEYLYGPQNQLLRKVSTALVEDGSSWILTNYNRFEYDAQCHLLLSNSLQYGIYDQNEYGFQAVKDTVLYEYDAQGLCVKETDVARGMYYVYTYDAEGRMVGNARWKKNLTGTTYANDLTLTYSDFCAFGPQTVVATATSSYNVYEGKITYDAEGHKTSEKHWSNDVLKYAEYWTYEDGTLTLYEKKGISSGEEVNATMITYENLSADKVRAITYTWSGSEWKQKGGSIVVSSSADFNGAYAPTIAVEQDATTETTVNMSITLPADIADFRIYRDGLLRGTSADASYDEVSGKWSFADTKVSNGTHEYFVQSLVGGEPRNISEVASITLVRQLPAPTALHAVKSSISTEGSYIVTVAWTNPVMTDDMGYIATHVMEEGHSGPLFSTNDAGVTTAEVNLGIDAVHTLYVQTQYVSGRFASTPITLDATKFLSGISENTRRLRVVETWGDAMGNESNACTKKTIYYYGADNRIQREGNYGKTLGQDEWSLMSYKRYIYGEDGQLQQSYEQQYGRYNYGEMGFDAPKNILYYEYNLEGQLVKQYSDDLNYTTYEYTPDGSLAKTYSMEAGQLWQSITYSDFVGKDKPCRTESDGSINSYKYTYDTEYDADGRMISIYSTKYSSGELKPYRFETFTYDDNGALASDTVYNIKMVNDVQTFTAYTATIYTPEEDNANRIAVKKYVWDSILKKFGNPKTWIVNEYTEIDATKYAPTLTLEEVADKVNTVRLNVTIPSKQQNSMTVLNVYRDGIEIAHGVKYYDTAHYTTDEYGKNGVWTYEDAEVLNGTYDYFVELARLDATLTSEASVHNVSNVESQTFNVVLPCATGLHEVSRRMTSEYNTEEEVTEYNMFVTLGWDAPADKEKYGFQRYNVMLVDVQLPENDGEENEGETYELAMRGRSQLQAYIQCVYKFGRTESDTLTIDENIEGIESLHALDDIRLQGHVLNLDTDATVSLYALDGSCVLRQSAVRRMDLGEQRPGVYILVIKQGDRKHSFKVRL